MSATLTPQANCPPQSECAQATQLTVAKEGQAVVSKMPTHRPGQRSPRAVSLKTGMSHTQAAPAKQQWVVLTTWEQIQTSNQNAGQAPNGMTSDYETGSKEEAIASPNAASSPGATTDGSVQPKSLRASQTTVTRLIFKFFPVDSSATQPAFVSLRNGWFVIQL